MDILSVLNTAFIVCLAMTILFFVVAVILFFLFDIKTIYMIRSGRAQAKTVKEMQEINASTGRLRGASKTGEKNRKNKVRTVSVEQPTPEPVPDPQPTYPDNSAQYSEDSVTTERLDIYENQQTSGLPAFDDSSQTTILTQEAETSVLNIEAETSVLNQQMQVPPAVDYSAQVVTVNFEVIKKIVVSDTDEVIR